MNPRNAFLASFLSLLAPALAQAAPTIDGTLDPQYGSPLSVQTTQTNSPDALEGAVEYSRGSELDQAFAFVPDGVLYLFLAGNQAACCPWEFAVEHRLEIFIDSKPGGQNQLRADNQVISPNLAGLTFDAGFSPDYWIGRTWVSAYYCTLPADSGGTGYWLGSVSPQGTGVLTGGTNPYGILASHDWRNTAGVTAGCGPGSGAGVTTGMEWAIPLSAIGNPTECIRVCAMVTSGSQYYLYNQVLGPLPADFCDLAVAGTVNFATVPGQQFMNLCWGYVPAPPCTWGRLKAAYR